MPPRSRPPLPLPPPKRTAFDMIKENQMWGEIREMAQTDPGMADLVDRVIVYYRLKKGN